MKNRIIVLLTAWLICCAVQPFSVAIAEETRMDTYVLDQHGTVYAYLPQILKDGESYPFPLRKLVSMVMVAIALWLLRIWVKERKGCKSCLRCSGKSRRVPSFAVGMAYGFSPCAPLMMVLGYAVLLPLHSAIILGIVFSLSSSLIPAVLTLILSGALSVRISAQLGKYLPWFQLFLYVIYLMTGLYGLIA